MPRNKSDPGLIVHRQKILTVWPETATRRKKRRAKKKTRTKIAKLFVLHTNAKTRMFILNLFAFHPNANNKKLVSTEEFAL